MFVSCLAVIVSLLQLFPVITASNTCNIFLCVFLFAGVFLNCSKFDLSGPPYKSPLGMCSELSGVATPCGTGAAKSSYCLTDAVIRYCKIHA